MNKIKDSLQNIVTRMGQTGKDSRLSSQFVDNSRSIDEYVDLWQNSSIGNTVATIYPDYMFKKAYTFLGDNTEKYLETFEQLNVNKYLHEASVKARVTGGAVVLLGYNDSDYGTEPSKNSKILWLRVFDLREIQVESQFYNGDLASSDFGKLKNVYLTSLDGAFSSKVHNSRLLYFYGDLANVRVESLENQFFGVSIYKKGYDAIRQVESAFDASEINIKNIFLTVYKMKDLVNIISSGNKDTALEMIELQNYSKSANNSIVIDAEDNIDFRNGSFSNIDKMLDKFIESVASAYKIPVSILMGRSPGGMNSSGDGDRNTFYDNVLSEQQRTLKPVIAELLKKLGADLSKIKVVFPSLYEESEKEKAETFKINVEAYSELLLSQVMSPEEVRKKIVDEL